MKFKNARTAVAAVALAALAVCLIAGVATGTWCGFGANDIAVLCPVGALLSMVAAKTLVPRAVISVVVTVALVLLLGRLFCGWACPVTLGRRVKEFFKPVKTREAGGGGPLSSEPGPRRRGDRSAERGVGDSRLRRLRSLPRQAQRAFRLAPCGARRCAADDGCVRVPRVLPRVPRGPHFRSGGLAGEPVRRGRLELVASVRAGHACH